MPQISIRLRRKHLEVISSGLALVEPELYRGLPIGFSPIRGKYEPSIMAVLRQLRGRFKKLLQTPASSSRLHLDAVEIAICAFGARLGAEAIGKAKLACPPEWTSRSAQQLLRKLETARKRAKRLWLRSDQTDEYWDCQRCWRNLWRWLHVQLNGKPVNTPRQIRRRRNRECLDKTVPLVKRELETAKAILPSDHELRRLVFLALQNIRRGRGGAVSIREVLYQTPRACRYVVGFVTDRLPPTTPNCESTQRLESSDDPQTP